MQRIKVKENAAYRKVTEALKKRRQGATVADIVAATALPLETVRELVPQAADEYSARLEVTESSEIRYSFPRGFESRYRGFKAGFKRVTQKLGRGMAFLGVRAFKVWIMVMLIGYFVLFMLIALASLVVATVASSSNSGSRRGRETFIGPQIFNLIIRLWFYSELTKSVNRGYYGRGLKAEPKRSPLHKSIFSFVFGEDDPNKDWTARENRALIAFIQAHRGLISLPEFMSFTGMGPAEAEEAILSFCAEYGGSPEASEEGTILYRFNEILLRTDTRDRSFPGSSSPIKQLKRFSKNKKSMNVWFGIINSVNLLFGGYFFYNALQTGQILQGVPFEGSYLYGITYKLLEIIVQNPLPFIAIGLGLVPLVFSVLFWLIPAIRFFTEKKENEAIKTGNLKRLGFSRIWSNPLRVEVKDIDSSAAECRPRNIAAARDRVLKEMGGYSVPDVEIDESGNTVYSFKVLDEEKKVLEKYRSGIDPNAASLGKTIFDSE
ncbi:MAG: hypothetical protein LBQ88_11750 [Treponema sp.]|jgi:hypothetical protein|nr:hypothetical protein [Treponema sp.]